MIGRCKPFLAVAGSNMGRGLPFAATLSQATHGANEESQRTAAEGWNASGGTMDKQTT